MFVVVVVVTFIVSGFVNVVVTDAVGYVVGIFASAFFVVPLALALAVG